MIEAISHPCGIADVIKVSKQSHARAILLM